jgi:hypothetical protein
MVPHSNAVSRFAARTVGQTGLAALAFAGALSVAPAAAGNEVALIESIASQSQRVELMEYARVGKVIRLSRDQTLVVSYRDSCVREIITGGTVTIGTEQSEVRSGEITRIKGQCTIGKLELTKQLINDAGSRVFRGGALH